MKGKGSVVSPCCVSLAAFNVGCCALFVSEYPLESWLCRSFGLGRKALTSAFHSESTTGHVDRYEIRTYASYLVLSSPLPPAFFLSSTSLFPPYLRTTSILFDDTREIYLESICGYVNDVRNVISVLSHLSPMADEAGQSLFLYRPIYRSIKLTVRNYCMVGRGGYFYSVNVIVTERLRKVKGRGGRLLRKGYQIWVISAKNVGIASTN